MGESEMLQGFAVTPELTAAFQKVFDGIQAAFDAVSRACRVFVVAVQRNQRRMRRRAARVEGRRHARSVGPWGLPWWLFAQHQDAPLDVDATGEAAPS